MRQVPMNRNKTQKLAIKYLFIGFGVGLLKFFILRFTAPIIFELGLSDPIEIQSFVFNYMDIIPNILVGLFILIDSLKYLRNKIITSILGFCIPVFGICFLLIENYLIEKSDNNG